MYRVGNNSMYSVSGLIGYHFKPYAIPNDKTTNNSCCFSHNKKSIRGIELHKRLDLYIKGKKLANNNSSEFHLFRLFLESFLKDNPGLNVIKSEVPLYSYKYRIGGRIDFLISNGVDCVIVDWKFCANHNDYSKNNNKNGRYPLDNYKDCRYSKWCVQLNLYRILVQECTGMKVKAMKIVKFVKSRSRYEIVDIPFQYINVEALVRSADEVT